MTTQEAIDRIRLRIEEHEKNLVFLEFLKEEFGADMHVIHAHMELMEGYRLLKKDAQLPDAYPDPQINHPYGYGMQ